MLLDVIVGTAGGVQVLEVTILFADVALHPLEPVTVTRYTPAVVATTACVVEPLSQEYAVADEEVSVTLPPVPILVDPLAEMVGVAGAVSMVVTLFADVE